jgi:hypothetical protein
MKAILEFTLPEEKEEYTVARKGIDYKIAIDEFSDFLRSQLKYGELSEEKDAVYDEIREKWIEILQENDAAD